MIVLAVVLAAAQSAGPVVVVTDGAAASRADVAWVGEALADLMPRDLAALGVPVVERADRVRVQESLGIPGAVALTRATSVRIGEALRASRLVVAGHEVQGDTVTLSARLLGVEEGTLSAPIKAAGPLSRLAELIHGLTWDVALAAGPPPALLREEFLRRRPLVAFEALTAYARGLAAPDPGGREKQLKRALELAPGYDEARLALGQHYLAGHDGEKAHEVLARMAPDAPLARPARFLQGLALLETGRYREAAALYAALAGERASAAVLNNQALALLRAPSPAAKASELLRKAIDLDPRPPELAFNLGWALLQEAQAEPAAFWLTGVLRRDDDDAHARLLLVWALRQCGRSEQAEQEWKALTATAPGYASLAGLDLSRRFERTLPSESLVTADQERSEAGLARAHVSRAEMLLAAGDREGAARELVQAAYLEPYDAATHLLLARTHRTMGRPAEAVGELRMSLWCREDAAVRLELALLLREMNRGAEARAEAQRVLEADPDNAAARELLAAKP